MPNQGVCFFDSSTLSATVPPFCCTRCLRHSSLNRRCTLCALVRSYLYWTPSHQHTFFVYYQHTLSVNYQHILFVYYQLTVKAHTCWNMSSVFCRRASSSSDSATFARRSDTDSADAPSATCKDLQCVEHRGRVTTCLCYMRP